MTTNTTADVDVRALPAEDFTASDLARIGFGHALLHIIQVAERALLTLGADDAVAGDYAAQARAISNAAEISVREAAVIAERTRGTSWEHIGKNLLADPEKVEARWHAEVEEWAARTKAQSLLRRQPTAYLCPVDEYITTGRTTRQLDNRPPLGRVLDAAAPLTGRDVCAADSAFAGAATCSHCHR